MIANYKNELQKVFDIKDFEEKNLDIFSRKILKMICKGETGWEDMLPEGIADLIKDYRLFGYSRRPLVLSKRKRSN